MGLASQGMTVRAVLEGQQAAAKIAQELVQASVWFEITPLPDDWWEVRVKRSDKDTLKALIPPEDM